VPENLPDHRRHIDAGDHLDLATALLTGVDLDPEHEVQRLEHQVRGAVAQALR
jgi:hypothetical protein